MRGSACDSRRQAHTTCALSACVPPPHLPQLMPLLACLPNCPQNMHQVHEYQPSEHGSDSFLSRKSGQAGCNCSIQ